MKNLVHKIIAKPYLEWFRIVPAITDELKKESFKIRHKVYCEELQYEPVHPSGLETDNFDDNSMHLLIQHRVSGKYIGSVRMIFGNKLPFLSHFNEKELKIHPDTAGLSAEISRLAVLREFRNRKGEAATPAGISEYSFADQRIKNKGEGTRFPYVPLGLYLGLLSWAIEEGVETLFLL
ncbi:MAG TPA: PEP-CTERM/exosortase system-associated acyltransferase, partial [Ignavibacteriaceae bacterium]